MAKQTRCANAKVFHSTARERVKGIHRLSRRYNALVGKPHAKRLLELMAHHVKEIEELLRSHNKHFLVETGDLAVLCLELLLEFRASPDAVMKQCFKRYERKLGSLLTEVTGERKSGSERQTKKEERDHVRRKKRFLEKTC